MKKIIFLLLVIITSNVFSQKNGEVEYVFVYKKYDYTSKNPDKIAAQKMADLCANYATNHKYMLKFSENESIYNVETSMPMDGVNTFAYKFSKKIFSNGVFFQNKVTKDILNEMSSMSQDFLVKSNISNDWKLSSETKYIGNYKCYKATSTCNSCSKEQIVTIWYTPEIPMSFGPAGFGGAPGLILEVSKFRYTLLAKRIKLSKKEIKIIKPSKGRLITKEELKELQKETRNRIMTGKRKN